MEFVSEAHILSYFSLPTDLASEMKDWLEFVEGQEYSVNLKSPKTGEVVKVSFVEATDDEFPYLRVRSTSGKELFERALGMVTYALAAHSDTLIVHRRDPKV